MARGYKFYVRAARKMPQEHKIHISEPRALIFFLLFGAQLSDIADFTAFSNNQALQQYGWASQKIQSSLWENSFISSSLCKTNLPATAIILNRQSRKKPTLFNAGKCGNYDDTRIPAMESASCLVHSKTLLSI